MIHETTPLNDETTLMIWKWMLWFQGIGRDDFMFIKGNLGLCIRKNIVFLADIRFYSYFCNSNSHYRNRHYYSLQGLC